MNRSCVGTWVLVVDDDTGMAETLADILEARQFCVGVAHSGDAAVAMTGQEPFDAVLMDIQMPGINGVEALRAMKARAPKLRVIMMSAYTRDELAREAEQASGIPVQPKPLDVDRVLRLVASREEL